MTSKKLELDHCPERIVDYDQSASDILCLADREAASVWEFRHDTARVRILDYNETSAEKMAEDHFIGIGVMEDPDEFQDDEDDE